LPLNFLISGINHKRIPTMKKKVFLAFVGLLVLVGVLGGIKFLQISRMTANGKFAPPPATVTTATAQSASMGIPVDGRGLSRGRAGSDRHGGIKWQGRRHRL
jgi:hypothetical protein